MKEKGKMFQTILLIICGAAAVLSVLVFSGKIPLGERKDNAITGNLVLWGTYPTSSIRGIVDTVTKTYKKIEVTYVQKDIRTYHDDIIEALASGVGPDLFFYNADESFDHESRLFTVPFTNYPDAVYRQTFIDQTSRSITSKGILGFPVTVDPLVMYYNRDILSSSFISEPPSTWDELVTMVPVLTKKTESGSLVQSAIGMGGYGNVTHAKDILSLLMLQTGSSVTGRGFDGTMASTLMYAQPGQQPSAPLALDFYTKFAILSQPVYTWNPSLPESRQQFLAGKLAFYIGYASEFTDLQKRNPNLPIAVSLVPQRASSATKMTYGTFTSIGISKVSKQQPAAVAFALWFTQADMLKYFADATGEIPARKDMLGDKPKDDAIKTLFYNSALISRGWTDPDAKKTDILFGKAVSSIVSGSIPDVFQAMQSLDASLNALLKD